MQTYIGTKVITARPMSRIEYNDYREWELPENENGADAGYLVEYLDGGQSNHPDHAGYISWSPKDVFERSYRLVEGLDFGSALAAIKMGMKVSRTGWNGKGMFLRLNWNQSPTVKFEQKNSGYEVLPFIVMKTADNKLVPWLASQTDLLAEDWIVGEAA